MPTIMIDLHPQYVTDAQGERLAVMLSVAEYRSILEELEMQEDIAAYDQAKAAGGESVPYDVVRRELGLAQ